MKITFSTCWYVFKAKFSPETYSRWIANFLPNVQNFYLVIYTDEKGIKYLKPYLENPNIKVIFKKAEDFYNYRYKEYWAKNFFNNKYLNRVTDWQVNMLWSEKVHFVNETIKNRYFPETQMYGWCDIGYFRNGPNTISSEQLKKWPSNEKIDRLNPNKVYYAVVNQNQKYLNYIISLVNNKTVTGVPVVPIPPEQITISGGFFIIHKSKIDWWVSMYDNKLHTYFKNNYLVKDDQIILADCIFSVRETPNFTLLFNKQREDDWFLFQKTLL
jgi:hypothetical protein